MCQVDAPNLELGAGFPDIRGLVKNIPKIAQGLVHSDTEGLGSDRKLCPLASIEAHYNMALAGLEGGGGGRNPCAGRTRNDNGRGR